MTQQEIRRSLVKAVQQFESEFSEWDDYNLLLKPDTLWVTISADEDLDAEIHKEIQRDFSSILKIYGLMTLKNKGSEFLVGEYVYVAEEGLEELADELEAKFGKHIINLKVIEKNEKPFVKFQYLGNMTSEEKTKLRKDIVAVIEQYQAVDADDVFADVEFDDFDEVMEEIKKDDLVEELDDEEIKAEDSIFSPGVYYHGSDKFKSIPAILRNQLRIDYKTNDELYERTGYSDKVEGDWKHDKPERDEFIEQYINSHIIVDVDTGEDYVILLAFTPSYVESFISKAEDSLDIDESLEELVELAPDDERITFSIEFDDDTISLIAKASENDEGEASELDGEPVIEMINQWAQAIAEEHPELADAIEAMIATDWYAGMYFHGGELPMTHKGYTFIINLDEASDEPDDYESKMYYNDIMYDYERHGRGNKEDYNNARRKLGLEVDTEEDDDDEEDDEDNFAEDMLTDLFAKDQIQETMKLPVNEKTDAMIWEAFKRLDSAIEMQDRDYAETLYNFVYAFDIEEAALDMSQYEDLLEKKDSVRSRIDAIEDYKAADVSVEEIEIDYTDIDALSELYDELYHKLARSGSYPGAIRDLEDNTILSKAFTELDDYLTQFGPLDEDVPSTLAKLDEEQLEGYVQIINKWMNYNE